MKMRTTEIVSYTDLENAIRGEQKSFLLIYRKDADQSECALKNIIQIKEGTDALLFTVDVSCVRDVHPRYHIKTVPSLLVLNHGRVINMIKGCQTPAYYESILAGRGLGVTRSDQSKKTRQVVVYTTPSCTWCNTLKTYLKEHLIPFREVNVATDTAQAEAMVRKSGQQGVPQTEIDGQIVVGFDRNRLNQLLQIPSSV